MHACVCVRLAVPRQGVLCSRMGEYDRALGHLQLLLDYFEKQGEDARSVGSLGSK